MAVTQEDRKPYLTGWCMQLCIAVSRVRNNTRCRPFAASHGHASVLMVEQAFIWVFVLYDPILLKMGIEQYVGHVQ